MELADIPRTVPELQGRELDSENPRYPRLLADLSPEDLRKLGEKYLGNTRVYRTAKPFFIDKMPNNFRHIGLIHLILPNAKIIDSRCRAMACCFRQFQATVCGGAGVHLRPRGHGPLLPNLRRADGALGLGAARKVLRVNYEDVVGNLEANVRKILRFCDLKYEPQCMEFYRTERSIRTASSEQVRRG